MLETLTNEFRLKIEDVLSSCKERGFILKPFYAKRSVVEQAKLWRQSRSRDEILTHADIMRRRGAPNLAKLLLDVGPQHGRWATNALPGESWHQWGEAVDCFVLDQNTKRALWSSKHEGYRVYAEEGQKKGLFPGYYWQSDDAVHIQMRREKPTKIYSWEEVDTIMMKGI